ncbi:MAG: NAD(P)-dependent oxidoreductase [Candidatus Cloacimonetes bacterium]|nr:NAD(P)-dependent oxidoreductase [Candidatus Cloacimonadota bacterium]
MKIAVTGANGFVGSNLANHLSQAGHCVLSLVRASADTSLLPPGCDIQAVDYQDLSSLQTNLDGYDVLIHSAGKTRTINYSQMHESNVLATLHILRALNQLPSIKHFIFISSQAVSGFSTDMTLKREDDPPRPITHYGKSKHRAEELIRRQCKRPWTIIRPVSVFGEGDHDFLPLFRMAEKGIKIRIGNRKRYVNLIYVRDLCRFIESTIFSPQTTGQILFASDGNAYCYDEIQDQIGETCGGIKREIIIPEALVKMGAKVMDSIGLIIGKAPLLNSHKVKEMLAPAWLCSIDKARELINWHPDGDLKDQFQRTYQWYKSQNWL